MATRYQHILDALAKRGYKRAYVEFDGGNDSGGPNHVVVYRLSDNDTETLNWNDPLFELLAEPVYDRYGSFAGEFYAEGTVEYDVTEGTVEVKGSESETTWHGFHEEY